MIELNHNIMLEHLTWPKIAELQKSGFDKVVFGVGSIEQHGPHLPLVTDAWAGLVIANRVATKLGNTLQAPTIRPGCSEAHMEFPGSMTISQETLKHLLVDYCDSLARQRFKTIIIVPSHGGNFKPTADAMRDINERVKGVKVIAYTDLERNLNALKKAWGSLKVPENVAGIHAGETETSFMLYTWPEMVLKKAMAPGFDKALKATDLEMLYAKGIKAFSHTGVLGNPTQATKEKGEIYFNAYVDDVVAFVREHTLST